MYVVQQLSMCVNCQNHLFSSYMHSINVNSYLSHSYGGRSIETKIRFFFFWKYTIFNLILFIFNIWPHQFVFFFLFWKSINPTHQVLFVLFAIYLSMFLNYPIAMVRVFWFFSSFSFFYRHRQPNRWFAQCLVQYAGAFYHLNFHH